MKKASYSTIAHLWFLKNPPRKRGSKHGKFRRFLASGRGQLPAPVCPVCRGEGLSPALAAPGEAVSPHVASEMRTVFLSVDPAWLPWRQGVWASVLLF